MGGSGVRKSFVTRPWGERRVRTVEGFMKGGMRER